MILEALGFVAIVTVSVVTVDLIVWLRIRASEEYRQKAMRQLAPFRTSVRHKEFVFLVDNMLSSPFVSAVNYDRKDGEVKIHLKFYWWVMWWDRKRIRNEARRIIHAFRGDDTTFELH